MEQMPVTSCVVPVALYEEMTTFLEETLRHQTPVVPKDAQRMGIHYEALVSCRRQMATRLMRRKTPEHRRAMAKYRKRWEVKGSQNTIFAIAKDVQYSPYLLARLFVEVRGGHQWGCTGRQRDCHPAFTLPYGCHDKRTLMSDNSLIVPTDYMLLSWRICAW